MAHLQEGQEPPSTLKRDFEHLLDLVCAILQVNVNKLAMKNLIIFARILFLLALLLAEPLLKRDLF